MRLRTTLVVVGLALSCAVGCGPKATPVTPSPLPADQQAEVGREILGRWKCTATKVEDGEKRDQPADVFMTFNSDGTYHHVIHGPLGLGMDKTYRYQLDGRNMTTDSPHGTYRVDAVSNDELTLFSYWATTTWYFRRVETAVQ